MMARNREEIERDIHTLCQQIQATIDSGMSQNEKRIILEGYGRQKRKLDAEKAMLLMDTKPTPPNCKVARSVPVHDHHRSRTVNGTIKPS